MLYTDYTGELLGLKDASIKNVMDLDGKILINIDAVLKIQYVEK